MNRKFWMILLACACLFTLSCQNNKKKATPEAVTEAFSRAFYTADFTHMYQYVNKPSNVIIETLQSSMKSYPEDLEKMNNRKVEIEEIVVVNQTDSTALCTCTAKVDGEPRHNQWDLVKEDGEWKVTLVIP